MKKLTVRTAVQFLKPSLSVRDILSVVESLDATFESEDAMWDVIETLNS